MTNIKIKRINKNALLPTENQGYFDIYTSETTVIWKGRTQAISTGLLIDLPKNYRKEVKSNYLSALYGLVVVGNSNNHYDELLVVLHNNTDHSITIMTGEKIAQLSISESPPIKFTEGEAS